MTWEPSDMKQQALLTEADVRRIVREEIEAVRQAEDELRRRAAAVLDYAIAQEEGRQAESVRRGSPPLVTLACLTGRDAAAAVARFPEAYSRAAELRTEPEAPPPSERPDQQGA